MIKEGRFFVPPPEKEENKPLRIFEFLKTERESRNPDEKTGEEISNMIQEAVGRFIEEDAGHIKGKNYAILGHDLTSMVNRIIEATEGTNQTLRTSIAKRLKIEIGKTFKFLEQKDKMTVINETMAVLDVLTSEEESEEVTT
ncbi:hypothetical protein HY967_04480 [Candidatus Jorgensenbacteria bacterium]|nr:hypothetical protein [Candidatus Jorgensenbacteria bacterium]